MGIVQSIAVYGIMSCGMLFVVLIGGLDLSVGSMAGLAASIAFVISQKGNNSNGAFLLGAAVAEAVSLAVGWIHGFLATTINIPSFVMTLATQYVLYGAIKLFTKGAYIYAHENTWAYAVSNTQIWKIPSPIVILIIIAVIAWFVIRQTTFGRRTYAIGGNPTAAKFVGINVKRYTKICYMLSSLAACIGGIVLASYNLQAGQTTGTGFEGMVLMAMIVGGVSLAGGKGSVAGALFGALLIGIIQSVVTLSPLGGEYLKFVQGVVILVTVVITALLTRNRRRKPASVITDKAQ